MITNRLQILLRAAIASALGLASLGTGAAVATPSVTAPDDDSGTVTVEVTPSAPTITPDGAMTFDISVENGTDKRLEAGSVVISTDDVALDSPEELSAWLNGEADAAGNEVLTVPVPEINAGSSYTSTPLPVTPGTLEIGQEYAAYPVGALYTAGDTSADARSTVVVTPAEGVPTRQVTVVMPMTVPPASTGLIDAETLELYTGVNGLLTRQLDAVANRAVVIGIDPMIIVSIRALGTSAPESAVAWLERLDSAANETFALQYGDADVTAQSQAGVATLLAPTSFSWALDPANFSQTEGELPGEDGVTPNTEAPEDPGTGTPGTDPTGESGGEPSGGQTDEAEPTPTGTGTPSPTVTPAPEDQVPTLAELLGWDYTYTGIVWPGADTLTAADLPVLAASGATTTIVSSRNVEFGEGESSAWAAAGDAAMLVAHANGSDALDRAVKAENDDEQAAAIAELAAQLAVTGVDDDEPILLAVDRGWTGTEALIGDALAALNTLPGVSQTSLRADMSGSAAPASVVDHPVDDTRVTTIGQLMEREPEVAAFATVANDPALVTGRERAELMSLLGVGWQADQDAWLAAVATHGQQTTALLGSVGVVATTPINMISMQTEIPVSVHNDLDQPVTVVLNAHPSNPRLDIDSSVAEEIPALSHETIRIPVEARIGNGEVTLRIQLHSEEGVVIGQTAFIPVDVRADWETIGITVLGAAVGLLFIGGLVRTIMKRRSQRNSAATQADGAADAGEKTDARTGAVQDRSDE
ncbi:hypothetical protein GCM10027416_00880 [Okibacterium endophyticum]